MRYGNLYPKANRSVVVFSFAIHNTSTKSAKKPKDRITRSAFISCLSDLKLPLHAVKFAKFFCTKHSLPQETFYTTTLFSSTGAFISFICDAKEQTSLIYFVNSYKIPLH